MGAPALVRLSMQSLVQIAMQALVRLNILYVSVSSTQYSVCRRQFDSILCSMQALVRLNILYAGVSSTQYFVVCRRQFDSIFCSMQALVRLNILQYVGVNTTQYSVCMRQGGLWFTATLRFRYQYIINNDLSQRINQRSIAMKKQMIY